MQCLYCGNPSPTIRTISSQSKTMNLITKIFNFANNDSYTFICSPAIVSCDVCGRRYKVIANGENHKKFLRTQMEIVLSNIPEEKLEHFAILLRGFNLDVDDLINGVHSLVIPESYMNKIKQQISKNIPHICFQMHLLFNANGHNYVLIIYKNYRDGKLYPSTIDKIV